MGKTGVNWSLRVGFGAHLSPFFPREKMEAMLDANDAMNYCFSMEHPGSNEHWQCAFVTRMAVKQDTIKRRMIKFVKEVATANGLVWEPKHDKNALWIGCKDATMILKIAGGYCRKEHGEPSIKGWTLEELAKGELDYKEITEIKKKEIPVTSLSLLKLLQMSHGHHLERAGLSPEYTNYWYRLTDAEKFTQMERFLITEGWDLSLAMTVSRRNYFIKFFPEYFEGKTV